MADAVDPAAEATLGLLVNPIAGMGGRVGLKGTDGAAVLAQARALGAKPLAGERARSALQEFLRTWPTHRPRPRLVTAEGPMGQAVADAAGFPAETIAAVTTPTSADDTRRAAAALREAGAELLLFAGGDGTARDVSSVIDRELPALGIPAGVKIQSAAFAASPRAGGALAAAFLAGRERQTEDREVVDLDEAAYREGHIRPRLHGYLQVPRGPAVQSRKSPTPASEREAMNGIAGALLESYRDGHRLVLGPGTTTRAVADLLGLPKTLVGVDVVARTGDRGKLLVADATETDLLRIAREGPVTIVLTPIGGQGFLLGRGNQQISPAVIHTAGIDAITIVATPSKLAALAGRPLLVDTGDEELDAQLSGHARVFSGRYDRAIVEVAAA